MTPLLGPSGAVWCGWGAAALLRDHGEDDALLFSAGLGPLASLQCALFSQSADQGQDCWFHFVPSLESWV